MALCCVCNFQEILCESSCPLNCLLNEELTSSHIAISHFANQIFFWARNFNFCVLIVVFFAGSRVPKNMTAFGLWSMSSPPAKSDFFLHLKKFSSVFFSYFAFHWQFGRVIFQWDCNKKPMNGDIFDACSPLP